MSLKAKSQKPYCIIYSTTDFNILYDSAKEIGSCKDTHFAHDFPQYEKIKILSIQTLQPAKSFPSAD